MPNINDKNYQYASGRNRFTSSLSQLMTGLERQLYKNNGDKGASRRIPLQFTLIGQWQDIVGEELANITKPLYIDYKFSKIAKSGENNNKNILYMAHQTGAKLIAQYAENEIIGRINTYFGRQVVDKISFTTERDLTAPDEKAKNTNIMNDKERKALYQAFDNLLNQLK